MRRASHFMNGLKNPTDNVEENYVTKFDASKKPWQMQSLINTTQHNHQECHQRDRILFSLPTRCLLSAKFSLR